jgi:uncharacterized protein
MKSIAAALLLVALAAALALYVLRDRLPVHLRVQINGALKGVRVDHSIRIRMPDGVELAASLYIPMLARGALPTVLVRLPYGRLQYGEGAYYGLFFARHGYAVLVQDIRGKFDSGGEFAPWRGATQDGVATLDWIAAQPWSSGKVGTIGCSALGELQFALSRANHPAHAAMIPIDAGGGAGNLLGQGSHFGLFEGGVLQLGSAFGWYLENGFADPAVQPPKNVDVQVAVKNLPASQLIAGLSTSPNAFDHLWKIPLNHPEWNRFDFTSDTDMPRVPLLLINTWGDQSIDGALAYAARVRQTTQDDAKRAPHVILAPGNHCQLEETAQTGEFGDLKLQNTYQPYRDWYLRWFDYWLQGSGDGLAQLPPYLYYVLGESAWRTAQQWPPENARELRWYLGGNGRANSVSGGGTLLTSAPASGNSDELVSDPANPVPSIGGPVCCTGNAQDRAGPVDQAGNDARQDILVYTSAPLQKPMRFAGPLRATLTVSSTAKDTDLVVRLMHVRPDGKTTNIQEGALRLRYRNGFAVPELLEPGRRYTVTVPMRSIAYYLPAGHRLRMSIASSNFPRLERNLQNGTDNPHTESAPVIARNRIFYGADATSYLELPIIEDSAPVFSAGASR